MTTSKFIVKERVNNEWQITYNCSDRVSAMRLIADDLIEDGKDPQNFKVEEVEEVEEVNTFGTLYEVANTICNRFGGFGITFKTDHLVSKEGDSIELDMTNTQYPSLNSVELGIIFEVVNGINKELPKGYEVIFVIDHVCRIRLMMSKPENKK